MQGQWRRAYVLGTALAATGPAWGAEIIWLSEPSVAARAAVEEQAKPEIESLTELALRTATTQWSDADARAFDLLALAIEDVRTYETRFDGEMLIMRDLAGPISSVGIVRTADQRKSLYAALAYQGFAVNRYFGPDLATDDGAKPFRTELDTATVETPWLDAVALDPEREITAYEIAEAPQRTAYEKVRTTLNNRLPATLTPVDMPVGVTLHIDGREVVLGPTGGIRVPAGRHLVHAELGGRILQRWDVRTVHAGNHALKMDLSDMEWESWFLSAVSGMDEPPPPPIRERIRLVGGEVWLATPNGVSVDITKITEQGVESARIRAAVEPIMAGSIAAGVSGGWQWSGNWFRDRPTPDRATKKTVNAFSNVVHLDCDLDISWFRVGAGVDLHYLYGEEHLILYAESATRLRVHPHLTLGTPWAHLVGGFALPHHPTVGARATVPVWRGLEARLEYLYGFSGVVARDPIDWDRDPLLVANFGVGWRMGFIR
jgi:hypothetical protein